MRNAHVVTGLQLHLSVHRYLAQMPNAHRFWRTTRFRINDMGIRRIAMFFPRNLHTVN